MFSSTFFLVSKWRQKGVKYINFIKLSSPNLGPKTLILPKLLLPAPRPYGSCLCRSGRSDWKSLSGEFSTAARRSLSCGPRAIPFISQLRALRPGGREEEERSEKNNNQQVQAWRGKDEYHRRILVTKTLIQATHVPLRATKTRQGWKREGERDGEKVCEHE